MKPNNTTTLFLSLLVILLPISGFTQSDDVSTWRRQGTIGLDVSVNNLAARTTAVIVACELYTRAPAAYGGKGYLVMYDPARSDNPGQYASSEDDYWKDRAGYEGFENLVDEGINQRVFVDIYGNDVDYRFWDKGQCKLHLYFNDLSNLTGLALEGGPLPIPLNCEEMLSGDEFYRLADLCRDPDAEFIPEYFFVRPGITLPEGDAWAQYQTSD